MSHPTGTRVDYRYTPVAGFPTLTGRGTVTRSWPDHLHVHPDDTGRGFDIHLHPSEVTPVPVFEQPGLDMSVVAA